MLCAMCYVVVSFSILLLNMEDTDIIDIWSDCSMIAEWGPFCELKCNFDHFAKWSAISHFCDDIARREEGSVRESVSNEESASLFPRYIASAITSPLNRHPWGAINFRILPSSHLSMIRDYVPVSLIMEDQREIILSYLIPVSLNPK